MTFWCKKTIRRWLVTVVLVLLGGLVPAAQPSHAQSAPDAFGLPWTPPSPAYRIAVNPDDSYATNSCVDHNSIPTPFLCVDQGGLYRLTYSDLSAAGLDLNTLDPLTIRVFYMGQELPIRVLGEGDGVFNPADVVLFYARTVDSLYVDGVLPANKYTKTNVYWLTYGGVPGQRMAEPDGSVAGSAPGPFQHRERLQKSVQYWSAYPFELDADHWFADQVTLSGPKSYDFNITNLSAEDVPGSLSIRLLGYRDVVHNLRVWLNNNLVIDGSPGWSMKTIYETTVPVPHAYFVEGVNTVKVGVGTADTLWLDWWDISYPDTFVAENNVLAFNSVGASAWRYDVSNFTTSDVEVYDVTDPFAPQRVINPTISPSGATYTASFGANAGGTRHYLALTPAAWRTPAGIEMVTYPASEYRPADLLSAANAADYILITHDDFWTEAKTLAGYRAYEFRVALVDVQQIYDQFNGGLMSAEAIRDFLAYAHANWIGSVPDEPAPAPAYVLLMGDGTNDLRKYQSSTNTYIPPYLYLADPDLGETAADNRFVTFIGDDNIPDMHIGRFPVNTAAQATAMVDKTMRYEVSCTCDGVWEKNTIFMADDLEDGGGNFYYYSDLVADGWADDPLNTIRLIPESYTRQKEYLGVTCNIEGNPTDAVECRGNLVNSLNTTGALFVSFVGHSTKTLWAVERMFNSTANSQLRNGPCLPIMLPMTCYEGSFFDYETPEVLAEASVRLAADPATGQTRGSVASFSPTGFGLVTGHDYLERGIMLAWFHEGITRLGASVTYAKQYLVDTAPVGKYLDLLDTFLLLGDPALQVKATEDTCLAPTGVVLGGFDANQAPEGVRVAWETDDESEILGFNILRGDAPAGEFLAVNQELILADHPGIPLGQGYSYTDDTVRIGRAYIYKLEIVKLDGTTEQLGLAETGRIGLQFNPPQVDR